MRLEEICEGYWKNIDIQNQERAAKKPIPSKKFHIMVNGQIWKKEGKPVEFSNRQAADKAVNTIVSKYNKTAQVVPV